MSAEQLFEDRIQSIVEARQTELPHVVSGGANYSGFSGVNRIKEAAQVVRYLKQIAVPNLLKSGPYGNRLVSLDVTEGDAKVRQGIVEVTLAAGHDAANEDQAEEALLELIDEIWDEAIQQVVGSDFFDAYPDFDASDVNYWID